MFHAFQSYFRMSETLDCYILLHFYRYFSKNTMFGIFIFSLLSILCQLIVIKVPSLHRISRILVLTFSVVNSTINLISFGLSDHYGVLHIIVLGLLLCTGSLQIILLGIVTQRKVTVTYNVHEHIV